MVDNNGKEITTTDNLFKIIGNPNSTLIEISPSNKGPGLFEGWLVTKNNDTTTTSIPLTVATKPLLVDSILLVIIGVGVSICLWEIVMHVVNGRKKEKKKNLSSLISGVQNEVNKAKKVVNNANQKLQTLHDLSNELTANQRLYYADDIKKIKTDIIQPTTDYFSSKIKSLQLEQFAIQPQIIRTEIQLSKYEKRNKSPIKSAGSITHHWISSLTAGNFYCIICNS